VWFCRKNSLGFSYRREVKLELDVDYRNEIPTTLGGFNREVVSDTMSISLPTMMELSGLHQLNETDDLGQQWTFASQDDAYIVSTQYNPVFYYWVKMIEG